MDRTESEMLPITAARDRLQTEREAQDRLIEELRKDPLAKRVRCCIKAPFFNVKATIVILSYNFKIM